ncbi:MFS transporter [Corynebacterium hylobatis]|uniref:MFS transporter n=1 Tax=Corynebacterium hylobatis TaxID=1859290 RepID=A0A3S0BGP1_9CORY|nr:MFS transporter [Corynebacterium hylobatis]RSZ61912.1 MFS transporter [Corynebacterium hylobatis]
MSVLQPTPTVAVAETSAKPVSQRRVAFATIAGTTVEWYDFFIYAQAAGLVFTHLMFEPAGQQVGLILSFASVGISFLFRPLGAFLAGHLGDRVGRRAVLVATLILMGVATTMIGLLPTYATIGVAAPLLLVLLRILQGISAGGEWGGAALMAVEHAPAHRRGLAGTYPQLGVPLGMLLAAGVFALMTGVITPGDAFLEWGWRVPFLLSFVLVLIGHFIRRSVDESPVFQEIAERKEQTSAPVAKLFRFHWPLIIVSALLFAGNNAGGYMTTGGFITAYSTNPEGPVGLDRTEVLLAVTASAAVWFVATLAAGFLSDAIGRRKTFLIGYAWLLTMAFPLFLLVNTGNIWMLTLGLSLFAIGLGLTYGPQASWYAELFPANVRFSGVSISYALGAILGGAFAPLIAQALLSATGTTLAVSTYLSIMFLIGTAAALVLQDKPGRPLGIGEQEEQEKYAVLRTSPRYQKREQEMVEV